jgi:hypothetical protein
VGFSGTFQSEAAGCKITANQASKMEIAGEGDRSWLAMNRNRWVLLAAAIFLAGTLVGYFVAQLFPQNALQKQGRIQQGRSGAKLGPWEAQFKPPTSIQLPDGNPVIRFEFGKVERIIFDTVTVTITNMTGRQWFVSYTVFGYDSKGRRVSEENAEFQIGSHESVVRGIWLSTYGLARRPASSFLLVTTVEQP